MMFRSLMLALVLVIAAGAASVVAEVQDGVASRLTLTREEWRCLQPRLDQYLRELVDPVLASVLGCGQPAASGAMTSIRRDPPIAPPVDEAGDADAARKVFFLTKTQIVCLKDVISSLIESGDADGLIAYNLSGCPAAAAR